MTKAERMKAKEREEAQKEGRIKPDIDADGKEINPHVPSFIADAPWYAADETAGKSSLRHQRYDALLFMDLIGLDMGKLAWIALEWILLNGMQEDKGLDLRLQSIVREHARIVVL